jgi:hypothetical protein
MPKGSFPASQRKMRPCVVVMVGNAVMHEVSEMDDNIVVVTIPIIMRDSLAVWVSCVRMIRW